MKIGCILTVGLLTLLFVSPAFAQKDKMQMGEALGGKVTRGGGPKAPAPIMTTVQTGPGVVQADKMHMGEGLAGKTLPKTATPPDIVRPVPTTTGTQQTFPLGVVQGSKPGIINVSFGDLKGQKIPATIAAALGFLVRWGGGTMTVPAADLDPATTVQVGGVKTALKNTSLQLPVQGLTVIDETPTLAHVRVAQLNVKTSAGVAKGNGVLTLTRASGTGPWRVSHVLVQ